MTAAISVTFERGAICRTAVNVGKQQKTVRPFGRPALGQMGVTCVKIVIAGIFVNVVIFAIAVTYVKAVTFVILWSGGICEIHWSVEISESGWSVGKEPEHSLQFGTNHLLDLP